MSTVHLIRHAKAKNRLAWEEPDHLRPLTKRGLREAIAIATRLAGEPIARVVTSPHLRCVQTLEPLAASFDLPLETDDALAEGADGDEAYALLSSLAGAGTIACCTHGDVLSDVVALVVSSGVTLRGPLIVPVAGTWILEAEGDRFVGGRFVDQPPR